MDAPVLVSIKKAAEALSIGRSTAYNLIDDGKLVTVTIGRRRLVRMDSLQALARGEAA